MEEIRYSNPDVVDQIISVFLKADDEVDPLVVAAWAMAPNTASRQQRRSQTATTRHG